MTATNINVSIIPHYNKQLINGILIIFIVYIYICAIYTIYKDHFNSTEQIITVELRINGGTSLGSADCNHTQIYICFRSLLYSIIRLSLTHIALQADHFNNHLEQVIDITSPVGRAVYNIRYSGYNRSVTTVLTRNAVSFIDTLQDQCDIVEYGQESTVFTHWVTTVR